MKKVVSILLALLMFCSVLSGCGGGKNPSANNSSGNGNSSQNQGSDNAGRAVKDTLNIALASDISSLDPQVGKEMRACVVSQQIFDTLVQWDPKGGMGSTIVPALAESWEYLDDCTLQLKLRQGVLFHNGEEMTADDVVYSIMRTVNSTYTGYHATAIDHAEKVDEYTVKIITKYPYGALLASLCVTAFSVVCKSVAEADEEGFAENPIGTGLYKFVSYTSGDNIQLEAFDECWRGAPVTKHINMMVIPENSQRTVMLETGEADIAYDVLPNDVERINENADLSLVEIDGCGTYTMSLNYKSSSAVGNKLVRQAIDYCLDKEQMVETVLYGHGNPAYGNVCPANMFYQEVEKRPQDLEKAKQLLADAGYPDGFEMSLWVTSDAVLTQYANIIKSELKKININVKIETMEQGVILARLKDEDYQSHITVSNDLYVDARYYLYSFYHSESSNNKSNTSNPQLDELLMKGRQILDADEYAENYKAVMDIIADEQPDIPLYVTHVLVGMNKNVFGFIPKAQGIHILGADVGCYE